MEGVGVGVGVGGVGGGRLGRSSSRYGSTTVFSGPVRKWTKLWLPITPPPPPPSSFNPNNNNNNNSNTSVSHLRLYKWTPLPDTPLPQTDTLPVPVPQEGAGEPPSKKFKFLPTAVLEEQKKEKASAGNGTSKKPDINDIPMEENQDSEENQTVAARQDLNELDLSLGLTSHEEEHDSDY